MIDFEGSPRYGVVEYGVVTLRGGQIEQTHSALCRPEVEMTAKEISLHGIRTHDAAGAPPFAEHRELFFSLHKTGAFCAHHASVENGFLKRTWAYPPLCDLPATGKACAANGSGVVRQVAGWGPWIDTRALFAAVYPGLTSYALGDLVETFALAKPLAALASAHCLPKRRKAHCALFDALASALLLLHIGSEEGFEQLSLEWLLEHSAASASALNEHRQQKLFE